ncbi:glycosyltransferase family protein [Actinokineospora pegani]|uniref:glycosyltransferase n=1 Tax=Actinokineospora pegani TaxID=2654637 RepID=UPI001F3FC80D|nr:glycosyltransferase [Actinokineospora pegani]
MLTSAPPLRVASVPADHPYVRHLAPAGGGGAVQRLDDPAVPGAPAGQWWPPVMLRPDWVRAHAADFDLLHLHFGFDDRTPAELLAVADALRSARKPLVLTVHDLRNPHHETPERHTAALDALIPAADALITLTRGAAARVRSRWGRTASVIPHPHVVDERWLGGGRPVRPGFVVGVHAKSQRANSDPVTVAQRLAEAASALPGVTVRVDAHDDERGRAVARRVERLGVDLRVHPRFGDEELWAYLASLDLSVLPYRFGTHSGWLEACHDLGTAALVPSCGCYAEQAPCLVYRWEAAAAEPDSLTAQLRSAWELRPGWQASADDRSRQRAGIAAAHERVYRDVLARWRG